MIPFDSKWSSPTENLQTKLNRLQKQVTKSKLTDKEIIFVGISAGAGLAMAYFLKYPKIHIHYLFSLSGVLDPNLNEKKQIYQKQLQYLINKSQSFKELVEFLTDNLTTKVINKLKIPQKVFVYTSRGETDGVVPLAIRVPSWAKHVHDLGPLKHVPAIIKTLIMAGIQQEKSKINDFRRIINL
jgi:esterase/lipase superfamily enzyme